MASTRTRCARCSRPGRASAVTLQPAFQQASAPLVERLDLLRNIDLAMRNETSQLINPVYSKQRGLRAPFVLLKDRLLRPRRTTRSRRWTWRSDS